MTDHNRDAFRRHAAQSAQGWEALALEITTSATSGALPIGQTSPRPMNPGTRQPDLLPRNFQRDHSQRSAATRQAGIAMALADLCRALAGCD